MIIKDYGTKWIFWLFCYEFIHGNDGDQPAKELVDTTADGLDMKDSVQEAFFQDDGFSGTELMAAVATDAGLGVELLAGGS